MDGERPVGPRGELLPTLEEEAAYQHAVLTAALARKPRDAGSSPGAPGSAISTTAAEAEFLEFMRRYPESPLVPAAVKRIARLHGGDVPKEAEAVWRKAVDTARERREGRERDRSLCGPEVLAEVLARSGGRGNLPAKHAKHAKGAKEGSGISGDPAGLPTRSAGGRREAGPQPADLPAENPDGPSRLPPANQASTPRDVPIFSRSHVPTLEELAAELRTDHRGTTLQALAEAAGRRGFRTKGLKLTYSGLHRVFLNGVPPARGGGEDQPARGGEGAGSSAAKDGAPEQRAAPRNRQLPSPSDRRPASRFLLAHIQPGHFVLVEEVWPFRVRVWDPSGRGRHAPGVKTIARSSFEREWTGVVLLIE